MATYDCPICLANVPKEAEYTLPCNHVFHKACLTEWMQPTCPCCRTTIPAQQAIEINKPNIDALMHTLFTQVEPTQVRTIFMEMTLLLNRNATKAAPQPPPPSVFQTRVEDIDFVVVNGVWVPMPIPIPV